MPRKLYSYLHSAMYRWSRTTVSRPAIVLFTSPVGVAGQVYSFESNSSHMCAAMRNYKQWRTNWALTHSDENLWPDNVQFIEADVSAVGEHVCSPVDAVSLTS